MTNLAVPAWDPTTYFPTRDESTWLTRPTGPCGDERCRADAWVMVRLTRRGDQVTEIVCGACVDAGRMQTWKPGTVADVAVLGTYELAGGGPRWLDRAVRTDPTDLRRFARPGGSPPAPTRTKPNPRPARQAQLLETAS